MRRGEGRGKREFVLCSRKKKEKSAPMSVRSCVCLSHGAYTHSDSPEGSTDAVYVHISAFVALANLRYINALNNNNNNQRRFGPRARV